MKHPELKMTKANDAERCNDSSGSYRIPAEWRVSGPSGLTYLVRGTGYGYMERPEWSYHCEQKENGKHAYKTGFRNRYAVLDHIHQREVALAATPAAQ